ncbi:MAG: hypothetical protein IKF90_04855 [Parasporobacterium sp.]|nr:hypothetical protein [Parasporobacterium sp.]
MPSIVYQTDKKTGIKYAYESTSYWDKEKKQPRSRRKYLGKVDPETGEIIPCKKEDNPIRISEADATEIVRLRTRLTEKENKIRLLEDELQKAKAVLEDQTNRLKEIARLVKIKE